jgi:hypothetical protein
VYDNQNNVSPGNLVYFSFWGLFNILVEWVAEVLWDDVICIKRKSKYGTTL